MARFDIFLDMYEGKLKPKENSSEIQYDGIYLVHQSQKLKMYLSLLFKFSIFHIFIFFSRTTGPISNEVGTKHA